jgi:hypothetical protein
MVSPDFRVEVVGHATLRVQCGGFTLLTDPWLVDPVGNGFHFPPLVHDPAALAAETDAVYISHVHPDHFNPPTLAYLSRDTPIYIGAYRRKAFRDAIRALGFPVTEVPFQQPVRLGPSALEIAIIEHDYDETAAYDSSIVIRAPTFTVFENNDCMLGAAKYAWVREHFSVDYAFLGYSPASFFPICFELDPLEKARLLTQAAERRYDAFVDAATRLAPRLSVPSASGLRFLSDATRWKNVSFNSAAEAVRRLAARGLAGEVMGPGDRIEADGTISRVSAVLDREHELAAIDAYASGVRDRVAALTAAEPPPRPDLVERFRDYILARWRETRDTLPGVRQHIIAYVLSGAQERRFYFDFSQADDRVFGWGDPPRYDMRYTYPSSALQRTLDGEIDWDELHFASASVHQVRYAKEFYRMLRSETLDLG